MRYYSKYSDETFEEAKTACYSGNGFNSIEEAISLTKIEAIDSIDEKRPFIVIDENNKEVWPKGENL